MKNKLSSSLLFLMLIFSANSLFAEGLYVKTFGGINTANHTDFHAGNGDTFIVGHSRFDTGYLLGLAAGYRFNTNFALEIEYSRRVNSISSLEVMQSDPLSKGDLKSNAFLLNGFYYFDNFSDVILPYVGIGIGFLNDLDYETEIRGFGKNHSLDGQAFAFQGILGVEFALFDNVRFFTEARAMSASSPDVKNDISDYNLAYDNYGINAGVTFLF